MKIFAFLFLIFGLLFASSIDKKIQKSQKRLRSTKQEIQGINLKLQRLAKNITYLKRDLAKIDQKLQNLDTALKNISSEYKKKLQETDELQKNIERLTQKQSDLKQKMVLLISQSFSKALLLSFMNNPTQEDIYKEEILKAIQSKADSQLQNVSKNYLQTKTELEKRKQRLALLQSQIQDLLQKKGRLKRLKLIKAKKMKKLMAQKESYDKELQSLIEQRKSLAATLQKLKILKSQQSSSRASHVKVKKYGQKSYGRLKTVRYRGPKTIPPLDRFIIVKRYGVYKDPIYNIEIPNENVELKPLEPNAKVKNVLNGKIVLAKWTPHLKNVVIVKHSNGLYTIYAYLDKLAPYIKKGRRVKKGHIIGRVSSKLIFEVTKNSAHLNPLDLIRVK